MEKLGAIFHSSWTKPYMNLLRMYNDALGPAGTRKEVRAESQLDRWRLSCRKIRTGHSPDTKRWIVLKN